MRLGSGYFVDAELYLPAGSFDGDRLSCAFTDQCLTDGSKIGYLAAQWIGLVGTDKAVFKILFIGNVVALYRGAYAYNRKVDLGFIDNDGVVDLTFKLFDSRFDLRLLGPCLSYSAFSERSPNDRATSISCTTSARRTFFR